LELAKLAKKVAADKAAKAASATVTVAAPSSTAKVVGDVLVEDVDEEAENENAAEEMTENTPETRVKVGLRVAGRNCVT
jgi:ethanolamine ammonia-lyase small subunit